MKRNQSKKIPIWFLSLSSSLIVYVIALIVFYYVKDTSFRNDFIGNMLATLFGLGVGVPFAVLVFRYQERVEKEKINIENKQRKIVLLQQILINLHKNYTYVKLVLERLVPEGIIYATPDLQFLKSTSTLKYDVIDDLVLNFDLDLITYSLSTISRTMDLYLSLSFDYYARTTNPKASLKDRTEAIEFIKDLIPDFMTEINECISKVNDELIKTKNEIKL